MATSREEFGVVVALVELVFVFELIALLSPVVQSERQNSLTLANRRYSQQNINFWLWFHVTFFIQITYQQIAA